MKYERTVDINGDRIIDLSGSSPVEDLSAGVRLHDRRQAQPNAVLPEVTDYVEVTEIIRFIGSQVNLASTLKKSGGLHYKITLRHQTKIAINEVLSALAAIPPSDQQQQ